MSYCFATDGHVSEVIAADFWAESRAVRSSGGADDGIIRGPGFGWSYIADRGFRLTQCEESGVVLNGALPKLSVLYT